MLNAGEIAIEIKGARLVDKRDMNGLGAFIQTYAPKRSILVCNEKEKRIHGKINILPWEIFLHQLWSGKIL